MSPAVLVTGRCLVVCQLAAQSAYRDESGRHVSGWRTRIDCKWREFAGQAVRVNGSRSSAATRLDRARRAVLAHSRTDHCHKRPRPAAPLSTRGVASNPSRGPAGKVGRHPCGGEVARRGRRTPCEAGTGACACRTCFRCGLSFEDLAFSPSVARVPRVGPREWILKMVTGILANLRHGPRDGAPI